MRLFPGNSLPALSETDTRVIRASTQVLVGKLALIEGPRPEGPHNKLAREILGQKIIRSYFKRPLGLIQLPFVIHHNYRYDLPHRVKPDGRQQ